MQNIPAGTGKGDPIHIESNMWHLIERINSVRGYQWARSIGNMWINLDYAIDTPYSTARAESIHCGGNFFKYSEETATHVKLVAYDWRADTTNITDNWFTDSAIFWKACAIRVDGKVINVANDLDVYFPLVSERPLWMNKKDVELFPDTGADYQVRGCDVYDGNKPLMTVDAGGRRFYTTWFYLDTLGVIPAK
jgi:hypothetical protein